MAHWGIAIARWTNPFAVTIRPPAQLQPASTPCGRRADRRENRARARVHRRRREALRRCRDARSAHARPRLRAGDGRSGREYPGRSRSHDLLGAVADRLGAADRQDVRESAEGRRASGEALSRSSRTIPASRTTSFTATTCRRWPIAPLPRRTATRRSRRPRRTRCTCRRTRSPASAPGRSRSTPTWRRRRPRERPTRGQKSCTRWTTWPTPICRPGRTTPSQALIKGLPDIAAVFDPNAVDRRGGRLGRHLRAGGDSRALGAGAPRLGGGRRARAAVTPVVPTPTRSRTSPARSAQRTPAARRRARIDRRAAGNQRPPRAGEGGVLGRAGRHSARRRGRVPRCWRRANATRR